MTGLVQRINCCNISLNVILIVEKGVDEGLEGYCNHELMEPPVRVIVMWLCTD